MKKGECYNCGAEDNRRDVDRHLYSYPDGMVFEVLDEFCDNCGTLLFGRDKRIG